MTSPQFTWRHLIQWHLGVIPLALLLGAGLIYFQAARRTPSWPRQRTIWFLLGLVVTFIATESVIGVFDMAYFSDHMIQHLLLIMVAAPIFALSAQRAGRPRLRGRLGETAEVLRGTGDAARHAPARRVRVLLRLHPTHALDRTVQSDDAVRVGPPRRADRIPRRGVPLLSRRVRSRTGTHDPPRSSTGVRDGGRSGRHVHWARVGDVLAQSIPALRPDVAHRFDAHVNTRQHPPRRGDHVDRWRRTDAARLHTDRRHVGALGDRANQRTRRRPRRSGHLS